MASFSRGSQVSELTLPVLVGVTTTSGCAGEVTVVPALRVVCTESSTNEMVLSL